MTQRSQDDLWRDFPRTAAIPLGLILFKAPQNCGTALGTLKRIAQRPERGVTAAI